MSWIIENITWVFSGIGVFLVGFILKIIFAKRKTLLSQKQISGDNSFNLQLSGKSSYSNVGVSSAELKDILGVFEANFYKLSEHAYSVALKRAEEFSIKFISTLHNQIPNMIDNIQDPAIQYALYNSQKEYAKSGDSSLRDILIVALIERITHSQKSFNQLVLDEALSVIPKLTSAQLDALSTIFLIKNSRWLNVKDVDSLIDYINNALCKFISNLSKDNFFYQHLVYAGCCTIHKSMVVNEWYDIELMFKQNYRGVFSKGFTIAKLEESVGGYDAFNEIIIPCYHDSSKYQFNIINEAELKSYSDNNELPDELYKKLSLLYMTTIMTNDEIKSYLKNVNDMMPKLFDFYTNSLMLHSNLTSVGLAIAQLNCKYKIGADIDLSIWLKDD